MRAKLDVSEKFFSLLISQENKREIYMQAEYIWGQGKKVQFLLAILKSHVCKDLLPKISFGMGVFL